MNQMRAREDAERRLENIIESLYHTAEELARVTDFGAHECGSNFRACKVETPAGGVLAGTPKSAVALPTWIKTLHAVTALRNQWVHIRACKQACIFAFIIRGHTQTAYT
jgi:hypothetical protein